MTDQVLRMTTAHLVRWSFVHSALLGFWTWNLLTYGSTVMRILSVTFGLLALRSLVSCFVSFGRRPALTVGPDVLTVTGSVGPPKVTCWSECSEFRPVPSVMSGHVRYQVGPKRRSLPAGFGDSGRRLTAAELADVLNRARHAAGAHGPVAL